MIDALTSPTLKYLRERWWNDDFNDFLIETLRPRPGNRILDVGCGEGTAEVRLGRLHVSQMRLFGVDLMIERVMVARHEAAAHNQRVGYAAADACTLPFKDGVFDSTFCVALLQHITDAEGAVREFARVTSSSGRVIAVEPDNTSRYAYSSTATGVRAFDIARRFFAAVAKAQGVAMTIDVGPRLAMLFSRYDIEPLEVRMFPVSQTYLGAVPDAVWNRRRSAIRQAVDRADVEAVRTIGREYIEAVDAYAQEATQAGSSFVELQHTMLFATVGQKR